METEQSQTCKKCLRIFKYHKSFKNHKCKGKSKPVYKCSMCQKQYRYAGSLLKHKCSVCERCKSIMQFTNKKRKKKCIKCQKSHRCPHCPKKFMTKTELILHKYAKHPVRNKKRVITSKKYSCKKCRMKFANRRLFYNHSMLSHYGGASAQSEFPKGILEDMKNDRELKKILEVNKPHILAHHSRGNVKSTMNYPTANLSQGNQEIAKQMKEIYLSQPNAYKINMAFGIILRNIQTSELRYYIPYENSTFFDTPKTIANEKNLNKVLKQIQGKDLLDEVMNLRPNSKWQPMYITNVNYYLYPLKYTLGKPCNLPAYIVNKANHQVLVLNVRNPVTTKLYKDKMCFFRALSYHRKRTVKRKEVIKLFNQWKKNQPRARKNKGVQLSMIPELEDCFRIKINLYQLNPRSEVRIVYKSIKDYADTINLDLYKYHVSYIKDFGEYAKSFQCNRCDRIFDRMVYLRTHGRSCYNKTTRIFPGGFHKKHETIFDRLESFGINVQSGQRRYEHFIFYDFESMLVKKERKMSDTVQSVNVHVPICVGISASLDAYRKPKIIFSNDAEQLVKETIEYMTLIQTDICNLMSERWKHATQTLETTLQKLIKDERSSKVKISV